MGYDVLLDLVEGELVLHSPDEELWKSLNNISLIMTDHYYPVVINHDTKELRIILAQLANTPGDKIIVNGTMALWATRRGT